ERDALLEAPRFDEIPRGVETVRRVEDSLHERRQREHALRRLAVCRAQLDVALEANLREKGREMEVPVVERRALARGTLGEKAAEGNAGHGGEVTTAAQDEVERHVQGP